MAPSPFALRTLLRGLLVVGLAACTNNIRTSFDTDPEADMSGYQTFAWISSDVMMQARDSTSRFVSPIAEQRIRRAVESELTSKGYRRVDLAEADLVVAFSLGTEEKVRVSETPGRTGVAYNSYRRGSWYNTSTVRVSTFTEGTLALEFYGRESRQAVWVGWASRRLVSSEGKADPSVIDEAVQRILEPFPYAGGAQPPAES